MIGTLQLHMAQSNKKFAKQSNKQFQPALQTLLVSFIIYDSILHN